MKRLFSFVALLMVAVVMSPVTEAKKFGGGKSFGKSFKTAPAPKSKPQDTSTIQKGSPAGQSSKKGLMGGLLGGLLAGGLLAALFAGGAFEGMQFMDILIMALIAFIGFKILRKVLASKQGSMNQSRMNPGNQKPAFGAQAPTEAPSFDKPQHAQFKQATDNTNAPVSGGFGSASMASDVPHNYPPGFDQTAFISGSREHYKTIQSAWNENELDKIQEYVSPEIFNELSKERATLDGQQHTEVMFVDAEIVRANHNRTTAELSIQFSGRYRDTVESVEEDIKDVWHLERDLMLPNAPWLIVGIE
ncbi:TIM44-like domain-containing protein [Vibrio sp.]|nr:TIM44-like domain-containing protein [Vibrio sp.]